MGWRECPWTFENPMGSKIRDPSGGGNWKRKMHCCQVCTTKFRLTSHDDLLSHPNEGPRMPIYVQYTRYFVFISVKQFSKNQTHRWARSDPQGVGGQNRFPKNLIFKRFAAKFFSKVSRRFSEGQKGIV